MIITNTQIVEALKLLKAVCQDERNDCDVCPLGNEEGSCLVSRYTPDSWKINLDVPKDWRALKW